MNNRIHIVTDQEILQKIDYNMSEIWKQMREVSEAPSDFNRGIGFAHLKKRIADMDMELKKLRLGVQKTGSLKHY
jgi:hypothetical protein